MKSDSIAFGVAGIVFGLIAGWIIGTQQAGSRPAAPQAAAASAAPAGTEGQTTRAAVVDQQQVTALKTDAGGFAAPRVIAGDFNANPSDSEIGSMNAVYFDLWPQAVSAGTATPNDINAPTHQAGWRPDYIFRSQDTMTSLVNAKIEAQRNPQTQILVSDHYPMVVTLRVQ